MITAATNMVPVAGKQISKVGQPLPLAEVRAYYRELCWMQQQHPSERTQAKIEAIGYILGLGGI